MMRYLWRRFTYTAIIALQLRIYASDTRDWYARLADFLYCAVSDRASLLVYRASQPHFRAIAAHAAMPHIASRYGRYCIFQPSRASSAAELRMSDIFAGFIF